jgi:hypothetical protein
MWAGPTQLTGLDLAQKGWVDLGPIVLSASLGSGPDLAQTSGLGQNRPGLESKNGEGNYFPPPILLHAEHMQGKLIPKMK